jgi:putative FmdB family regulatory protein
MPIYEYRCGKCRRRVDIFVQGFSPPGDPSCTKCGSKELSRIYSGFAMRRSKYDKGVYDDILSDGKLTRGLMRNDPRALAEWTRRMSRAADEVVTPESQEIMDRLDRGEDVSGMVEEMKKSYFSEEAQPAAEEE